MLYLEDYLELIEHLPSDLRERFTDMREMDLQVIKSCVVCVGYICRKQSNEILKNN